MQKKCSKCNKHKLVNNFYKNRSKPDGYATECKVCQAIMQRDYIKRNREFINKRQRAYYHNPKNRIKINGYRRIGITRKKKNNPLFKFSQNIRCLISQTFRNSKFKKTTSSEKILGCNIKTFRKYIEAKFEPWMSWKKYGRYNGKRNFGFDLDHIVPIAVAKTKKDIIKLNHYTNFQPLCSYVNRHIKRDLVDFKI